jgi:SAM-dependent methyltransferase
MKEKTVQKLLGLVKRNYSEIAAEFDVSRKKYLWPEMEKLAQEVKSGDKILDAGCGNGRLLEAFKNKDLNYFGFDNSRELIELAKKNYSEREFVVLDILNLNSLPDNNYDFIFCVAVILHLPGKATRLRALNELAKKLKKGGRIFISVWDLYSQKKYGAPIFWSKIRSFFSFGELEPGDLFFAWKNNQGEKISRRYYHAFTEKEIKNLVAQSGLKEIKNYQVDNNLWLVLEK